MSEEALKTWTNDDFDNLNWHLCIIWGWELVLDYPDEEEWLHDIVFRIDFIAGRFCDEYGDCGYMTAPARLVFHEITNLKITLDWGRSAPSQLDIDRVTRERMQEEHRVGLKPRYSWKITCRGCVDGEISFEATGFTQTLLAEPTVPE